MAAPPPESDPQPPWVPRFGLGSMLLVTFVFSVMGAAGYYLVRALESGRTGQLGFILFTLASPLLLLVVLSLAWQLFQGSSRRRQ